MQQYSAHKWLIQKAMSISPTKGEMDVCCSVASNHTNSAVKMMVKSYISQISHNTVSE